MWTAALASGVPRRHGGDFRVFGYGADPRGSAPDGCRQAGRFWLHDAPEHMAAEGQAAAYWKERGLRTVNQKASKPGGLMELKHLQHRKSMEWKEECCIVPPEAPVRMELVLKSFKNHPDACDYLDTSEEVRKEILQESCALYSNHSQKWYALYKAGKKQMALEAFGLDDLRKQGVKARNDNSLRFGNFTRLAFDPERGYAVRGCDIEHYPLERSRVCQQPGGEQNYHVFYQLIRSGRAAAYGLHGGPGAFAYTRDGASALEIDDSGDFLGLCDSMQRASFGEEPKEQIFAAVAAVLHLGNAAVERCQDTSRIAESDQALDQACALLGVDAGALRRALTTERIQVAIARPVGQAKAVAQRNTVAKTVHARLFDSLVGRIDRGLGCRGEHAVVGHLDIFGFEDMATNGFEQMFIDLTNERIQKLFNDVVIERELCIYKQEGILGHGMFDPGLDNAECVHLFTAVKPLGFAKLLSGQCQLGDEHDGAKFVQVLNQFSAPEERWKKYFWGLLKYNGDTTVGRCWEGLKRFIDNEWDHLDNGTDHDIKRIFAQFLDWCPAA